MVEFIIDGDIAFIIFNSPPHNYLDNPEFVKIDNLNSALNSNSVKGLIIKGVGRNFSAGADFKSIKKLYDDNKLYASLSKGKRLLDIIEKLEIPVISIINGVCFGGGLEIVLSTHIKIASHKSLFAFPETNNNLMPGFSGTYRLSGLAGRAKAIEMILSGDIIDTTTAHEYGIIDYVVDDRDAGSFGLKLMKKMITDRPIKVINSVIRSINNTYTLSKDEALLEETKLFCDLVNDELQNKK